MKKRFCFRSAASLLALLFISKSEAGTVTLSPAADTTLHEFYPSNNFGGYTHVAAGAIGSPKPNSVIPNVTRGLFRFDLSSVPKSSKVTAAALTLKVTLSPGGAANSTFEVRRVFQPWAEGKGDPATGTGNQGAPAQPGETTWLVRSMPSTPWSKPGGAAPGDFSSVSSASVPVTGVGSYALASNSNLVADVQAWVDNPDTNYGWILISQSENVLQTARRFGSREDPNNAPALVINYDPPGAAFRITNLSRESTKVVIRWSGGRPLYQVQKKSNLNQTNWINVGTPATTESATIPAAESEALFRVAGDQAAQKLEPTAQYDVTFEAVWSPSTHPQDYPQGAHWSGLVGGTHNDKVVFWQEGQLASDGIKDVAELGSKPRLLQEVNAALQQGTASTALSGGGIGVGSGIVKLGFEIKQDFPLVTLVSMIAPSPDWFVGVSGLSLTENGKWVDQKVVPLFLYDAGTDSGPSYASPDQPTNPRQPIRKFTTFPALVNGSIVPFGTFTFVRKGP